MNKQRTFLSRGLFEKDFMQTRIKTHSMSFAEKFLGYALSPGCILIYFYMVLNLRELFYMQVMQLNVLFNNHYTYFALQTTSSVIGVITGILVNYIIERTVSRAGRFRPYVLIGTWVMALSGIGMFWTPFAYGSTAQLVWLYAANIIYYGIGIVLYEQRGNVASVSTRNILERNFVTTMRQTISSMIPGVFVSLVVMGFLYDSVLLPDTSGNMWRAFIAGSALIAMVFSVVEYFYTRERITEQNRQVVQNENGSGVQMPLMQQLKVLLTNKYFLLSVVVMIGVKFFDYLQGGNSRTYMVQYILGGNAENNLQFLYMMISMQPMAIGAVVVPMLSRKYGSRRIMQVSAVITLVGIGISMINPYNFINALAGGFVFACGIFAVTNMVGVFGQQAGDDIEHKHGFRYEGTFSNGLIVAVYTLVMSPMSSLYETVLSSLGFQAPVTDPVTGAVTVFQQSQAVENWMLFSYYGSYAIFAVIIFVVCIFFDLEKRMPQILADLKERRKQAVLARGEEWVDEEEQERLAIEEAQRLTEENRIKDLKEKCAKKGLDFDKENQKYLDKVAKKQAKHNKKASKVKK